MMGCSVGKAINDMSGESFSLAVAINYSISEFLRRLLR